jgi:EAL domain-containing protein (putative c-di-GMP-specific phosphodiesterase class I)
MAEQTGLIRPLTQWVLEHAMRFCKTIEDTGVSPRISINISAVNLGEKDFVANVDLLLKKHKVDPKKITLEVTETATMVNPVQALKTLTSLQEIGVRLSIDDFGTGHSSLAYLKTLPVHEIKIDKSFVMEMATNADDATIVKTTINMCQSLGYEVVAEGVENAGTCELLSSMGCDVMQGFHLARPMPLEAVLLWMHEHQKDSLATKESHA